MTESVCLAGRKLILASASPRRKEFLERSGCAFTVIPASVDETTEAEGIPGPIAEDLAERKARAVAEGSPEAVVLGADTIVALPEDGASSCFLLGKPEDFEDACAMLEQLQGRRHLVVSGFCLMCSSAGYKVLKSVETSVWFRSLSDEEIRAYASIREPFDKAGAYGIQGVGGLFVSKISGSYSNVVGLPVCEVLEELKRCGVWQPSFLAEEAQRK